MDNELRNIANEIKNEINSTETKSTEEFTNVESNNNINSNDNAIQDSQDQDDDETIIVSTPVETPQTVTTQQENNVEEKETPKFINSSPVEQNPRKEYVKQLIKEYGMTIEEAEAAADKRFDASGNEINKETTTEETENSTPSNIKEDNGKTVIVKVADEESGKIEFTDEEKEKLHKADAIKLVAIKDEKLKSVKFSKFKKKDKLEFLRHMEKSISRYSVPLPALGEFCQFKGAQTVALLNNAASQNESTSSILSKKAALLYSCFIGGTTINKFDGDNNVSMSFTDFINKYKFNDVDLGLYAIFVASAKDEIETSLHCPNCDQDYKVKYKIKSLLSEEAFTEEYKNKINDILGNSTDAFYINRLVKESEEIIRIQSNETGNIYDIENPSLAKALRIFSYIKEDDTIMNYCAGIVLYLNCAGIKRSDDEYIAFGFDEDIEKEIANNPNLENTKYRDYNPIAELFDIVQQLPQYELDLLIEQIRPLRYRPEFILNSKCGNCGRDWRNQITTDEMVFLAAQGSTTLTDR